MPRTLLDSGNLPIEELLPLATREATRPRPQSGIHRWFARRIPTVVRGILIASKTSTHREFWEAFYQDSGFKDKVVLDPFVGGGTSVVEAQRLGATTHGVDVDPVACAITKAQLNLDCIPDLSEDLKRIRHNVADRLAPLYIPSNRPNELPIHFFWVQQVDCTHCGVTTEAHPTLRLAFEAEGRRQWVFCPACHSIYTRQRDARTFWCGNCERRWSVEDGPVSKGVLSCRTCGHKRNLISLAAEAKTPPQWRLFAIEFTTRSGLRPGVHMAKRSFRAADQDDHDLIDLAAAQLNGWSKDIAWLTSAEIERTRTDRRVFQYGYRYYGDLYNPRQLLHLATLSKYLRSNLSRAGREHLALAFSNHLATNCMLTSYASGWRRLSPAFAVRAYRHIPRPVEVNPWLDGVGRGTYPNAVRSIVKASQRARRPKEPDSSGGFRAVSPGPRPKGFIRTGDARSLSWLDASSIDLVLTDPPYFDNIQYSELSGFFLPAMQHLGLVSEGATERQAITKNLAAQSRTEDDRLRFTGHLASCWSEINRVLKPEGRLVFTFRHSSSEAWHALASSLLQSGLEFVQLFPILGDGRQGLHQRPGTSRWDAVFVMRKGRKLKNKHPASVDGRGLRRASERYRKWDSRLSELGEHLWTVADRRNFWCASIVADAVRADSNSDRMETRRALPGLLDSDPPKRRRRHQCRT